LTFTLNVPFDPVNFNWVVTVSDPIPLAELPEVNEPSRTVMAFEERVWSVRASVAVHEMPLFV